MSAHPVVMLLLIAAVVASSISVVYTKHQSRKSFIQLQALASERDAMDVEWGQLQLELSTLTSEGQVEIAARDRLGMMNLSRANTVIVKP